MRGVAQSVKVTFVVALMVGLTACSGPKESQVDKTPEQPRVGLSGTGPNDGASDLPSRGMKTGSLVPGQPLPDVLPVYFDFDSSSIRADQASRVDAVKAYMAENAEDIVLIEGHCDERGTTAYNQALGQRRADAVYQELVSTGVDAGRLDTVSYGEDKPASLEKTEEGWALNRRAEFRELVESGS